MYFLNFIRIGDGDKDIVYRYITEGELLTHGRYLTPDSVLFNMEHYSSRNYLNNYFDVIEPLEIYTFDDLCEMGYDIGDEE